MPTLILSPEYKIIISFYLIVADIDADKLTDIYLKKFNYKKIFYKEKVVKFNKKEAAIKDLQDFIFSIISTLVQKHIKGDKRNIPYKKFKTLKTCLAPINYV